MKKDNMKTYTIILLVAYIIGTKVIVYPLGFIAKLIMVMLGVAMWVCSYAEKGQLHQLSYLAPLLVGCILAA